MNLLVQPEIFFEFAFAGRSGFEGTLHGRTYCADFTIGLFGIVYQIATFLGDDELFAVGTVFGQIFYVGLSEIAQTAMQGDVGIFDTLYFHALHDVATEMQTCGGGGYGTFVLGKNTLKTLNVFGFCGALDDFARQGSFSQGIKLL